MMTSLMEVLTPVRQPVVELIAQVTLWTLLGSMIYLGLRRYRHASRTLLLSFCLGTLVLSLMIFLPLRIWGPSMAWNNRPVESLAWTTTQQLDESSDSPIRQALDSSQLTIPASPAWRIDWATGFMLLLLLLGAFVLLSLLRLLLGLVALEHWRRSSIALDDPALQQLADELHVALGVKRSVKLRVTQSLGSPATIGWWRPTILLPASWTEWTMQERRAVLAHELAHVRQGDYPLWLLVQLAAAMHSYHPLVRWLVHRLHGELELAADTLAAPQAGGANEYMRSLCQLALRHGSRGAGTLALALLPVHLPLSWRMMMMRSGKIPGRVSAIWPRVLLGCVLGAAAVLIAGLRGPVKAEEPKQGAIASVASAPVESDVAKQNIILQIQVLNAQREMLAKIGLTEDELQSVRTATLVKLIDKDAKWTQSAVDLLKAEVISRPQIITTSGRPGRIEIGKNVKWAPPAVDLLKPELVSRPQVAAASGRSDGIEMGATGAENGPKYGLIFGCLPVIQPDGRLRLTISEEVYSVVQLEMLKAETRPSSAIGSTLDIQFGQSACYIMPSPQANKQADTGSVIVTLVRAIKVEEVKPSVSSTKTFSPGKEKPANHPDSQPVHLQFHVVEMKRELLSKMNIDPAVIEESKRVNMGITTDMTMDQIQEKFNSKIARRMVSGALNTWSEVPSGVRSSNNQHQGVIISCTPCMLEDVQSIRSTITMDILPPILPPTDLDSEVIPQSSCQVTFLTRLNQNNFLVVPVKKPGTNEETDNVVVAFFQVSKPKPQPDKASPKPTVSPVPVVSHCYEIDIKIMDATPQLMEGFWKDVDQKDKLAIRSEPRVVTENKANDLVALVQAHPQGCTLQCPRILVKDSESAQVASGGIKITCGVKQLVANKLQLTFQEERAQPTEDNTRNKVTIKHNVVVALNDGECCCMSSEPFNATPGSNDQKVMVTMARVRRVLMNPVATEEAK